MQISERSGNPLADARERHNALDWLRVFGTLAVFTFHSLRFFDGGDWNVKNNPTSHPMDIIANILIQWIMPLFFVLSGVATRYALRRQSAGAFVNGRIKRLFVPLVFGVLVLSPHQVYLERVTHGQYTGSFWSWLPHYFDGFYMLGGNFAWMGLHLWYVLLLFLLSLLFLPLFLALRRPAGQGWMARTAAWLSRPGAPLLLFIPVAILDNLIDPNALWGTRATGGWNYMVYIIFFLSGYLFFAEGGFQEAVRRHWLVAAVLAIVLPTAVLAFGLEGSILAYGTSGFHIFTTIRDLNVFCWLYALIGLGLTYCNARPRFIDTATEAVMPFYMLHQPVLLFIGYYVVQAAWVPVLKWATIYTTALVVIIALVTLVVRPWGPMRVLFGLKLRRS